MEILAPCGGPAHIKAAVYAGADAVYLGGYSFSARRNAVNFSRNELTDAIRFCHGFGVRVYVTVNILTHDQEMEEIKDYLTGLAESGPDALIIQDLGVASLCKKTVPDLPIHASTQLSVHSLEGARFCAEAGFTRVVIARECSKGQLEEIIRESPVEIEAFVHGALCVSVSGQCGLSAAIGGRSGNRGLCAQPCRLNFSGGKTSFALSLKDLSLVKEIPLLKQMGTAAVKIEGRMKRPEYVAAAVMACRSALEGGEADMDGLRAVFSRGGFTQGYFHNKHAGMNGVRTVEDTQKSAGALAKYAELTRSPQKRVTVEIAFTALKDKSSALTIFDGTDKVTVTGGVPESAVKRETSREEIKNQLNRLGETPFVLNGIKVRIEPGLFLPASKLNAMRRNACEALLEKRVTRRTPVYAARRYSAPVIERDNPPHPFLRVHCETAGQAEAALSCAAQAVVPIEAAGQLSGFSVKIIVSPGRFITDEKSLLNELCSLRKAGAERLLCQNPAHVRLGKQAGFSFLHGGLGLNVFNTETAAFWKERGLTDVTASMELTLKECLALQGGIPAGMAAYGRLPLMLLRRCPFGKACGKNNSCPGLITDRTKRSFPVVCRGAYHELLNADILWMADKLREMDGAAFLSIYVHNETPEETHKITRAYTEGGEPPQGFTRGLLYRGVE